MSGASTELIEHVFRAEYGRAVSALVRLLGDIDRAEEAVQEAFAEAVRRWPSGGVPPSPAGWIITTARSRAIDRFRRESTRDDRERAAVHLGELAARPDAGSDATGEESAVPDDRLSLVFTCCHPALAKEARVALTLRLLGGLSTVEIAKAFFVEEATMARRLTRAKAKIRDAKIPYRVPRGADLPDRLDSVLAVIYLVYNEGYVASYGQELVRDDLCDEAIRLGRVLAELMPDEPEALGLLALMLLIAARRPARTDPVSGEGIRLGDQDRSLWDRLQVDEGRELVRRCIRQNQPGRYQLQAAINAVHSDATSAAGTDWRQIVALYDHLLAIDPSPVIALNRAVAISEVDGADAGLAELEGLALEAYHPFHAVRGELLLRLGRREEAFAAFDAGQALTGNAAVSADLRSRRSTMG